jgi:DNA repair protein RecO (recombination protein O)
VATIQDDAFCIRHWDFSETSQTVSLFGRTHGMIRGLAKGSRRQQGSFSGGFDLFTRGEIIAIQKVGRDLSTLTEWSLHETFPVLRADVQANRAAWYLADLIVRFMHHPEPHPKTWDALCHALQALQAGTPSKLVILAFQWVILDDLGYRPRLSLGALASEETVAFDPGSGGVVEDTGNSERWRVRRTTIDLLSTLEQNDGLVPPDAHEESVVRASKLLGAWVRELTGRESLPMRLVFES